MTNQALPFLLLAMIEDDVEDTVRLATRLEVNAFQRGFALAAGALGGPGFDIFVRYDGRWELDEGCEEEQRDKIERAIKQCARRGIDVS